MYIYIDKYLYCIYIVNPIVYGSTYVYIYICMYVYIYGLVLHGRNLLRKSISNCSALLAPSKLLQQLPLLPGIGIAAGAAKVQVGDALADLGPAPYGGV